MPVSTGKPNIHIIDIPVLPLDYVYDFNDFEKFSLQDGGQYDGTCSFSYKKWEAHSEAISCLRTDLVARGYVLIDLNSPKGSDRVIESWIGKSRIKNF